MRPDVFLISLPEVLPTVSLHPLHPGLASVAPLHHALNGFQAVEIVAVHAAIADTQCLVDLRAPWHLDRRCTPCHRQAGTCHEWEAHAAGSLVHLLRPIPVPGKMLVAKHGYGPPAIAKYLRNLPEKFVAWILR